MKLYYNQVSSTILDVKVDKRNECFNFGSDNAFPSLIEALISMSITSKNCADRVAKAIYGKSFGDAGKVKVNSKGQSLNEVLRIAARQYSKHNNCYLQVTYDANLDVKAIVVVPVTDVRIGKADDKGYSGKFLVYDNWDKSKSKKIKPSDFKVVDKYNPEKKVIEGQIRAASKEKGAKEAKIEDIIQNYNGQILHLRKDDGYIYSLTDLNPALSEALLEANSQTFRSRGASKGFLNTKLLTVQPFKDDDTRKEFKKDLNSLRGAENSSDVLLLETSQQSDDLSKQVKLDDLSGTYNDKLFEYSDKQAEKNICKAFTVPLMLVSQTDNSLFGSSGEMLKEAKLQLWENREEERDQFEEVFSGIMKLFQEGKKIEEGLKILNPYVDEQEQGSVNINKQAQATLRGSVGGVTAILDVVKAVKEQTIDRENAVSIIVNIYGFSEKKAKQMVGGFDGEGNPVEQNSKTVQN
ncbi:MAG: hypothetical protein PVG07_00090 [Acidobacteriota bacterium]|jgi:hypothetical protein